MITSIACTLHAPIDPLKTIEENHGMAFPFKPWGEEKKTRRRFILSIDGGGMRGIIPAWILGEIDKGLKEAGDYRPLYSHFDLVVGTSTGALIASALSIPTEGTSLPKENGEDYDVYTYETKRKLIFRTTTKRFRGSIVRSADPSSFAGFYMEKGSKIFPQKSMSAILGPIFTDKYSGSEYEKFLRTLYGEHSMDELMIPTALISYSTDNGMIFPITSWNTGNFKIWEGARASSAAPLYFPAFSKEYNGRRIQLIDGGVAANNPSLIAYRLGRELYPDTDIFHILSLSTAAPVYKSTQDAGGLTGWGGQITKIFQNASLCLTDEAMNAISDVDYTRIWAPVLDRKIKLDETSRSSVDTLLKAAERMYSENSTKLDGWIKMLSKEETPDSVKLRVRRLPSPPPEEAHP